MPEAGTVEVVTTHVWRVPSRGIPRALAAFASDRRRVRRTTGVTFAKLLGTSQTGRFRVRDADATRWVLITSWSSAEDARRFDHSPVLSAWTRGAEEIWTATLRPLAAHGQWSRQTAFGLPRSGRWAGPVAAITRGRIRPARLFAFWRSIPAVNADLVARDGLCFAFGIGEAPVGVQGTFSLWRDSTALTRFAYWDEPHRRVVEQAGQRSWFAEALFARFGVLSASGTIDGRDPMASLR
jgi:heme-degrading monooxygenase HmoA